MAVKRMVFLIGDSNCAGNTPSSTLSPGFTSYAGVKTDHQIWNIQTQAWANYEAGVNSYTTEPGLSYFGPEVSIRSGASLYFSIGEILYTFKAGIYQSNLLKWNDSLTASGGASGGVNYKCWLAQTRDIAYTVFYSQLVAAITAAKVGGHTVAPQGIVVTLGVLDALTLAGSKAFGALLESFIIQLRKDLETANGVAADTYLNLRAVIVKPHNRLVPANAAQAAQINAMRVGCEAAKVALDKKCRIVRTDDFAVKPDNVHFNETSNVVLGGALSQAVFQEDPVLSGRLAEPTNPIDVYLLIGDSHMEGVGEAAALPGWMTAIGGIPGIHIWNPHALPRAFQQLELNVNNHVSLNHVANPAINTFGPEFGFGEAARQLNRRNVYLIKGSMPGTFAAKNDNTVPVAFPFFDGAANDWNPASKLELYDRIVFGWALDALINLIITYGAARVRLRGVYVCLGTNDAVLQDGGVQANEVAATLTMLASRIRQNAEFLQVASADTDRVRFVFQLPDSRYADLTEFLQNRTGVVRAGIQKMVEADDYMTSIDPTALGTVFVDGIHYDGASNLKLGKAALDSMFGPQVEVVLPLFNPTREHLVNGLRLKGVPEKENAQDVIDESIQLVRTNFYRRLGLDRIAALRQIAFTKLPTTADDFMRLLAQTTETKWVRLELMRIMPLQFVDGSAPDQTWQNEAAFRTASIAQIAREMQRIRTEIDEAIAILSGEAAPEDGQQVRVISYSPEDAQASPGDTVRVQGGAF